MRFHDACAKKNNIVKIFDKYTAQMEVTYTLLRILVEYTHEYYECHPAVVGIYDVTGIFVIKYSLVFITVC